EEADAERLDAACCGLLDGGDEFLLVQRSIDGPIRKDALVHGEDVLARDERGGAPVEQIDGLVEAQPRDAQHVAMPLSGYQGDRRLRALDHRIGADGGAMYDEQRARAGKTVACSDLVYSLRHRFGKVG